MLNKAQFKIFVLSPDYYLELKRRLNDKFIGAGQLGRPADVDEGSVQPGRDQAEPDEERSDDMPKSSSKLWEWLKAAF